MKYPNYFDLKKKTSRVGNVKFINNLVLVKLVSTPGYEIIAGDLFWKAEIELATLENIY